MRSRGVATEYFIWSVAGWSRCHRNRCQPDATGGARAGL